MSSSIKTLAALTLKTLAVLALHELRLCISANQLTQRTAFALFFAIISNLGNGIFWYVLLLSLPLLFGMAGFYAMLHAGLTAIACALLYWTLKGITRRPRPFRQDDNVQLRVPPIDEFSFPSGHTLLAVAISLAAISWFPVLAWLLIPFTLLVAVSRVVLGLHYPSDVLAGALIGCLVAIATSAL